MKRVIMELNSLFFLSLSPLFPATYPHIEIQSYTKVSFSHHGNCLVTGACHLYKGRGQKGEE